MKFTATFFDASSTAFLIALQSHLSIFTGLSEPMDHYVQEEKKIRIKAKPKMSDQRVILEINTSR